MSNKIILKSVTKKTKRLGRGISAGGGKTSGRGTKGQKSRAGHNIPKRFEGGQTPLSMRLPKLPGFKTKARKNVIITLDVISNHYKDDEVVSEESLIEKKLIKKGETVKILSNGKLTKRISIRDLKASQSVLSAINIKMKSKTEESSK